MANERFTELPPGSAITATDIFCDVQGYVSPSVLGTSTYVTAQQILNYVNATVISNNATLVDTDTTLTSPGNYYVTATSGTILLTLPATAVAGSQIKIGSNMSGGAKFRIVQDASQQMFWGTKQTTAGTGGYFESTGDSDGLTLTCVITNIFYSTSQTQGNITIV